MQNISTLDKWVEKILMTWKKVLFQVEDIIVMMVKGKIQEENFDTEAPFIIYIFWKSWKFNDIKDFWLIEKDTTNIKKCEAVVILYYIFDTFRL